MIDYDRYMEMLDKINSGSNTLWNTVTFITVAEVVNLEVDLRSIASRCESMQDAMRAIQSKFNKEINSLTDDQYDQESENINAVESLAYRVDGKLDIIDDVISKLRSLADSAEEDEYSSKFSDIRSLDIGESRKFIRLSRLS